MACGAGEMGVSAGAEEDLNDDRDVSVGEACDGGDGLQRAHSFCP